MTHAPGRHDGDADRVADPAQVVAAAPGAAAGRRRAWLGAVAVLRLRRRLPAAADRGRRRRRVRRRGQPADAGQHPRARPGLRRATRSSTASSLSAVQRGARGGARRRSSRTSLVTGPADGAVRRVVDRGERRARPVRRRHAGVRLHRHRSAQPASSRCCCADVGIDIYAAPGCTELPGLVLVYTYFQIPLMVLVFLPALDGIRPQWREAATNLGGTDLGLLAARRPSRSSRRRSSAPRCCCSPTRSPRTRRRPR